MSEEPILYTNQYSVPPTFHSGYYSNADDPFAPNPEGTLVRKTAQEVLEHAGITFGPGAGVIYGLGTSALVVKNTAEQMKLIEVYLDSLRKESESAIQCRVDIFEAPRGDILQLLRKHDVDGDQAAAFEEVLLWLAAGKAFHRAGILSLAQSGNRSKTKSGKEVSYIIDYELKNGTWNPNWEWRNSGTILEIDPFLGPDKHSIDLNLSVEHHFRPPTFRKGTQTIDETGEKGLEIDLPTFYFGEIQSQLVILSGHTRVLGILEDPAGNENHSNIVFVSARIAKSQLFEKTFDEKRDLEAEDK